MSYIGKEPAKAPLTSSDVTDDIITLAKMAAGTDGNVITYDTSGNPAVVATGTSGQFLKSQGAGNVPVFAAAGGAWNLIKTLTSDGSDTTLDFVNGASDVVLDNTYKIYCFKFVNIHSQTNAATFNCNFSDDTSSHSYDLTKTSACFRSYMTEAGTAALNVHATGDHAQSTSDQVLDPGSNANDADGNSCGELFLFNPSDTTYTKQYTSHFITHGNGGDPISMNYFIGGYVNTTAAVTAVRFLFSSGEIQGGTISLYGLST